MKRRLLLINPAHVAEGQWRGGVAQFSLPPLNLGYVAALTPPGWTIRIIDENLRREDGTSWAPDLVGITTLTSTAPRAYALAGAYRQRGIPVVLGGIHPSALPDEGAEHADCVVVGDAETAWPQLVADFEAGQLQTRYQGDSLPLDGLPTPRRDLYPSGYFAETLSTSRGCTNRCDFCSVWRFFGRRYRARPIDEVMDELAALPTRRLVFFVDDNLTLHRRRTIALCQRIVERGVRCRYAIQGTPDLAEDAELLYWLSRSGCLFLLIGFESLSQEALVRIGKPGLSPAGVSAYREHVSRIRAQGMVVFGSFIVGLDQDTPGTFRELRDFVLAAGVDCALVHVLHPLPGTVLWEQMRGQGRLLYTDFPPDYALYNQENVSFRPAGMTAVQLQEGTRWLIASLTRLPVTLRRAWGTWRHTRDPLAAFTALAWNWRTHRSLRSFPLRDVRGMEVARTPAG